MLSLAYPCVLEESLLAVIFDMYEVYPHHCREAVDDWFPCVKNSCKSHCLVWQEMNSWENKRQSPFSAFSLEPLIRCSCLKKATLFLLIGI